MSESLGNRQLQRWRLCQRANQGLTTAHHGTKIEMGHLIDWGNMYCTHSGHKTAMPENRTKYAQIKKRIVKLFIYLYSQNCTLSNFTQASFDYFFSCFSYQNLSHGCWLMSRLGKHMYKISFFFGLLCFLKHTLSCKHYISKCPRYWDSIRHN